MITPEQQRELARLAVQVALDAPIRQGKYSYSARIPWSTVDAIRAACEAAGVDWRKYHKRGGAR